MKNLKSLFSAAVLACSSMMFAAQSNAALISESVYVGGLEIASMTMELDDSLINSGEGVVYISDDLGFDLVSWFLPISAGLPQILNSFEAAIDVDNIFAGTEFIAMDAEDVDPANGSWYYSIAYDFFATDYNLVQIYDDNGEVASWGGADVYTVTSVDVSEPSMLALFALALGGLVARRRA